MENTRQKSSTATVNVANQQVSAAVASVVGDWKGAQWIGAMDVKSFMQCQSRSVEFREVESNFTMVLGDALPWIKPNILASRDEMEQIKELIPPASSSSDWLCGALCCLTGLLAPYMCCKTHLIPEGRVGFSINSGQPAIMAPGWHMLSSPFNCFQEEVPINTSPLRVGPVTVVRVPQGHVGLAVDNTSLQLLMPGTHARSSGLFSFLRVESMSSQLIEFQQIKFLTVPTGFVRVCFLNGAVIALAEGRYAINTPVFQIGPIVDVRQENLRFSRHIVLLDGGVSLECEGLLTYQIVDPVLLTKNMGADDVERALQDVTKAELAKVAKVFASVYLEQLSGLRASEIPHETHVVSSGATSAAVGDVKDVKSEASNGGKPLPSASDRHEEEWQEKQHEMMRMKICTQVTDDISPICEPWGVKIIKFQLETTRLADQKFGAEYEAATLAIAKAKATLKSNAAENLVKIQQSRAEALAVQIEAEGKKSAQIIQAQGLAESMRIESEARQNAAHAMKDKFGQDLALYEQQVKLVGNLKATTLVLGDKSLSMLPLKPTQLL